MEQRIGTCSLCGGNVVGFVGAWLAVVPPPPPKCTSCGAVAAGDIIQMARPGQIGTSYGLSDTTVKK